jgi:hypothetical protein
MRRGKRDKITGLWPQAIGGPVPMTMSWPQPGYTNDARLTTGNYLYLAEEYLDT